MIESAPKVLKYGTCKMNLLYQRIGGHEGISRLLRHFYADVLREARAAASVRQIGLRGPADHTGPPS